ncbi:hypothetical protein CWE14_11575 [Aliidiomarina soli]|uniref:Uncharacterized protein n=1 Tax=Aliidiomarina soli TaxID=1928574 RepID=A0A432WE93_9GAMM|nr:hypothetical protein CWE14_11575 [Aliidiomarina soli]
MRTFEYTWKAFWVRQLKNYALVAFIFTYLWNAVAIGEWIYALFDSTAVAGCFLYLKRAGV